MAERFVSAICMCCQARREVIAVIQFAIGIMTGIFMSAVAAMVGYCIYVEHKCPEIRDRYLAEMEKGTDQ